LNKDTASLQALFYPRGVAVVGSMAQGKLGYELIHQLRAGGYNQLYAVNPKAQGALNAPGFADIATIPDPVDLAVIAAPAVTVPATLEACGPAGIRAAVIISSGFSEAGNAAGEAEIKRIARKYGIRIVGPNCAGILNTGHHLFATLESRPPAGSAAFVSQSGALGGAVLSWAEEQGLGISKFVSYGNRADLDEIDLLPYLADDPDTKVAALYIESVADGRAFMQAVQEFTRRKPLVVIKSGRSRSGQRAALSHTGSMAGADAVYDSVLRQCGAIRVETVEEMFDLCKGFVQLPPVRGRRVAIVTNSGGPGVLAADRAEARGLEIAEPDPALRERLAAFLPGHAALRNPVDLTVEGTETGYRETLRAMLESYDAALALNVATPYLDSEALARGIIDAAAQSGKPVVANFMAGPIVAPAIALLQEAGLPNYAIGERAMNVLAGMADYEERRATSRPLPGLSATSIISKLPQAPILEPDAMAWLEANGLPIPPYRFVTHADTAVTAARELGYPVVMKVVSPKILHKSEHGGVILNLTDDTAVADAFARLASIAAGLDFRGAVIYPQFKGGQEVLLGLSRDPQFGPVVVFGLGGIYTELWRDIALRVAPVDRPEADAMIRQIRAYPLLTGARGKAPCDLEALAETIVRFSELPFRYPTLQEIDLNPLFVFPQGLAVGDVRIITQS